MFLFRIAEAARSTTVIRADHPCLRHLSQQRAYSIGPIAVGPSANSIQRTASQRLIKLSNFLGEHKKSINFLFSFSQILVINTISKSKCALCASNDLVDTQAHFSGEHRGHVACKAFDTELVTSCKALSFWPELQPFGHQVTCGAAKVNSCERCWKADTTSKSD